MSEKQYCNNPADIHIMLMTALMNQDIDQAVALYHPDAVFVPGKDVEPVQGHEGVREQLRSLMAVADKMELIDRRMYVAGDTALVRMEWKLSGDSLSSPFVAIDVLRRTDGGHWLFQVDNPYGV